VKIKPGRTRGEGMRTLRHVFCNTLLTPGANSERLIVRSQKSCLKVLEDFRVNLVRCYALTITRKS
jgi:hypothetical protein